MLILGPSFFVFGVVFFGILGAQEYSSLSSSKKIFFDFSLSRFWHFDGGTLRSHRSSSSGFFSSLTLPFRFSTFKGRSSPCSVFVVVFELVPWRKQGGDKLIRSD